MSYDDNLMPKVLEKMSIVKTDDHGKSVDYNESQISVDKKHPDAASEPVTIKISYAGDETYKPAEKDIEVTVSKSAATITVSKDVVTYNAEAHLPSITVSRNNVEENEVNPEKDKWNADRDIDYFYIVGGVDATISGFISIEIPKSTQKKLSLGSQLETNLVELYKRLGMSEDAAKERAAKRIEELKAVSGNKLDEVNVYDYLKKELDDGATLSQFRDIVKNINGTLGTDITPEESFAELIGVDPAMFNKLLGQLDSMSLSEHIKIRLGTGPCDAGEYPVVALIADKNYQGKVGVGNLLIKQRGWEKKDNTYLKFDKSTEDLPKDDVDTTKLLEAIQKAIDDGTIDAELAEELGLTSLINKVKGGIITVEQAKDFDYGVTLYDGNEEDQKPLGSDPQHYVHTLIFGLNSNNELVVVSDKAVPAKAGIYFEVGYTFLGNYVAPVISRAFVIGRYISDVDLKCYNSDGVEQYIFTYKDVYNFEAIVTDKNGNVLQDCDADIYYVGHDEFTEWPISKEAPENAGVYLVSGAFEGNDLYRPSVATKTLTITRASISPTVKLKSWIYGEEAKTPVVYGNKGNGDVKYLYSNRYHGKYTTEVPTEAGIYYIKAQVAETRNYKAAETPASMFAILKADLSPAVLIDSWVYGEYDSDLNAPRVVGNIEDANVSYEYATKGGYNWSKAVPTEVGDYTVRATIEHSRNFKGATVYADFAIIAKSGESLNIEPISDQLYTGNAIEPGVVIKNGDKTLAEGIDYDLEYEDNVEPGAATAVIKFKGNYSGSQTVTFRIYGKPKAVLLAKATAGKGSTAKVSWNEIPGATEYVVYGNKCSKNFKKIKTTTGKTFTVKKIAGKKLKAHTCYKFYVVAKTSNGKVKSKTIHYIVGNTSGKYANVKSITAKTGELTLVIGETQKVGATYKMYSGKKHIPSSHGSALRFISDCPDVATVNSRGEITAIAAGTAIIYIQDAGGKYCKTIVTVEPAKATEKEAE